MNTLTKQSYSKSIEDIRNRTDILKNLTSSIREKFDYNDFQMYSEIKRNILQIEKLMKEKNFQKKVEKSKTLKILTNVHSLRELDFGYTCNGSITWEMWDKYIDIIKLLHKDIKWKNYSDLDLILCLFLWCSNGGPNYYNKEIKKESDNINVPNMRPGRFGSIEFLITIDGYIKNSIEIPLELLQKINENTYHSFLSLRKTLKYCEDKKIRLIKIKYKGENEIYGLKPDNYDDFCRINFTSKKKRASEDWIEHYKKRGFLETY